MLKHNCVGFIHLASFFIRSFLSMQNDDHCQGNLVYLTVSLHYNICSLISSLRKSVLKKLSMKFVI